MADSENRKTTGVTAIVPAYNERERIGEVLAALTSYPEFDEVIVVDDGSKDGTAEEAAKYAVRVIQMEKNGGKARAMDAAVQATTAEIILFCDADMRGLTHEMVRDVLRPVLEGDTDMMVAMHGRKVYDKEFVVKMTPRLGGLRAVRRELWDAVPDKYKRGFHIEAALNFYARHWGRGFQYRVFPDLKQTIKEKKYGIWKGAAARTKMEAQVIASYGRLHLRDAPEGLRRARLSLVNLAGGTMLSLFGLLIVFASYSGPVEFLRQVFADEIAKGPAETPIINVLLSIAANAGVNLLATIGLFIVAFGFLVVALNLKHIRFLREYEPGAMERV